MDEDEVPEKAEASSVPILSVVYRLQVPSCPRPLRARTVADV